MAVTIQVAGRYDGREIQRAQRDLERMGAVVKAQQMSMAQQFAAIGNSMANVGRTLTLGVTLPIVGFGAVAARFASNLEESQNKVDVVFGESAAAVRRFAETSARSLGMSEEAALSAAGTYGNLFRAMGISTDASRDMSLQLVQLAADLASFNNAAPEEVFDALRSGLTGEIEPLRRFGVNLTQARIEAEALNLGLIQQGEELTAAAKAQAAFSLIMQDTALAQGDFARTSDGAANQMRILKAQFTDIAADLGGVFLPIITSVMGRVAELGERFKNLSPEAQRLIVVLGGVAAALGPILWVSGRAITGIMGLGQAIGSLLPMLVANPWMLVVVAVLALVAALVAAYFHFEGFREVVNNVFGAIGRVAQQVWNDALKPAFEDIGDAIQDHVMPAMQDLWEVVQDAWPGIQSAIETAWSVIQPILAAWFWVLTNVMIPIWTTILRIWTLVFRGIVAIITWAWNTILQPIFSAIGDYISNHVVPTFQLMAKVGRRVWDEISERVRAAWQFIQPVLDVIRSYIQTVLIPVFNFLWQTAQRVWSGISSAVSVAWGVLSPIFNVIRIIVQAVLALAFNFLWQTVVNVWNGISSAVRTAWSVLSGIWNAMGSVINGFLIPTFQRIVGVVSGVWNAVAGATNWAWGILSRIFSAISGAIGGVGWAFSALGGVVSGVANAMVAAWSYAVNAIRNIWNSTLGGKGVSIPDIPGLPGRGQTFRFPTLHQGGVVPGFPGTEVPALLEAGEVVLSRRQVASIESLGMAAPSHSENVTNVTYNVSVTSLDPAQAGKTVVAALKDYERRNGTRWRQ